MSHHHRDSHQSPSRRAARPCSAHASEGSCSRTSTRRLDDDMFPSSRHAVLGRHASSRPCSHGMAMRVTDPLWPKSNPETSLAPDRSIHQSIPLPDPISNSRRTVLIPSLLSIATRLLSRFATHLSPPHPAHSMHDLDPLTITVQQGSPRLAQDIPQWLRPHGLIPRCPDPARQSRSSWQPGPP